MPLDDNEDPEDRLEREQLERSSRRMRKIAFCSGVISITALGAAFLLFALTSFLAEVYQVPISTLVTIIWSCVVLVAMVASLVDLCLVTLLAWRGEGKLASMWLLGVPGAGVSLIFMAYSIEHSFFS